MANKYLLVLIFLSGCGNAVENSISNSAKTYSNSPIVAFGDSITAGTGATKGFVQRIADVTQSQVTNYGIGSSRIDEQIFHIRLISIPKGSIIVFLTGMNDVLRGGDDQTQLDAYIAELKEIMDSWESQGLESYIGLPLKIDYNGLIFAVLSKYPCTAYSSQLYTNAILDLYSSGKYQHIHLVNTHDEYLPDDSNNFDGIHPNDIGAQIIANSFLKYMR